MSNELRKPLPGTIWQHSSGRRYDVLCLANECSDQPERPTEVVFQGEDGKVHTWPLADWHQSFEYLGVYPVQLGH